MRYTFLEFSRFLFQIMSMFKEVDLSTISLNSAPVPINVTISPVSCSISSINFLPSGDNFEYSLIPSAWKNYISLVKANWVALFNRIDLRARSISNGQPSFVCLSRFRTSPPTLSKLHRRRSHFSEDLPTRVTYDLKTRRTSSILFGPTPTSEHTFWCYIFRSYKWIFAVV